VVELHHAATVAEDPSDLQHMSSAAVDLAGDKLELVLKDVAEVRALAPPTPGLGCSVATSQAARGWAHPPCRHLKNQS
jgi:hypothetical protein